MELPSDDLMNEDLSLTVETGGTVVACAEIGADATPVTETAGESTVPRDEPIEEEVTPVPPPTETVEELEAPAPATTEPQNIEVPIAEREDDAQAFLNESHVDHLPNFMHLHSRYIALTNNPEGLGTDQVVGLRFTDLHIPQGSRITKAYLQFTVFEPNDTEVSLSIHGEATDDAAAFAEGDEALFNISNRPTTHAFLNWVPPA